MGRREKIRQRKQKKIRAARSGHGSRTKEKNSRKFESPRHYVKGSWLPPSGKGIVAPSPQRPKTSVTGKGGITSASLLRDSRKRTLVVGDGDFSFSRSLLRLRGRADNLVCTGYDSRKNVLQKYGTSASILEELLRTSTRVAHSVDATRLHLKFSGEPFDQIVFNFPHTGMQRVHANRVLLKDFFSSAAQLLLSSAALAEQHDKDGQSELALAKCSNKQTKSLSGTAQKEIYLTLKCRPPYTNWNVKEQAAESGLVFKGSAVFDPAGFPGYQHQTTDPEAVPLHLETCRTFVFMLDAKRHIRKAPEIGFQDQSFQEKQGERRKTKVLLEGPQRKESGMCSSEEVIEEQRRKERSKRSAPSTADENAECTGNEEQIADVPELAESTSKKAKKRRVKKKRRKVSGNDEA